jgi:hypothetical protein
MTITTEWPTDQEICDIARNEAIPLSAEAFEIASQYHRISQALSVKLGHENLNWPGFAQWSSKAVGSSLRLGNHSGFLRQLGRHYHVPVAAEPLFRLCTLAFLGGSYGTGLSVANRSIFVEMASFHTYFLSGPTDRDILRVHAPDLGRRPLLKDLGEPGLARLHTAYQLLDKATSASGQARSELMLGANIALSSYEQARVQPALELVFYRPVRWALQVSWRTPYGYLTHHPIDRYSFYGRPHHAQTPAMQWVEDRWVRMYSNTLWLKTAIDTVALGRPLTCPPGHSTTLLRAPDEFEDKSVRELVREFGPSDPADLQGVSNWLDYEERMRFITAYFMIYQQITQMFEKPRFKRKRLRGRPQALGILPNLTFRKVMFRSSRAFAG